MKGWIVSKCTTNVCKLTQVNCKYHNIGCGVWVVSMCIKEDEGEDKHHLQVALEKNITLQGITSAL